MEINLQPEKKQHLAYEALRNPDVDAVLFGGGAGGGKSWLICESRLVNCLRFGQDYKSFIGRKELKRLMASTYITWGKVCRHHNIPAHWWKLNGQYNYIEFINGARIDLIDVNDTPADPMFERFGSTEYTDGAIEEGGEVSFKAYDVLKSRVGRHGTQETGLHPNILITANPTKNWLYSEFYKPHKQGELPSNLAFIQALFSDNKYTAKEYRKQLAGIKDRATKQRLMYGNWEYDDDENALIDFDAIVDLRTNSVPASDDVYLICDVARFGGDKIRMGIWRGFHQIGNLEYSKKPLDWIADELGRISQEYSIPRSHILVDEDGVGGGVVDILKGCKGFMANTKAYSKNSQHENYKNLKTQCAYTLVEMINARKIRVTFDKESDYEMLEQELEQIKQKDADKEGYLMIQTKDEIKKALGRSPDLMDTFIMRMYFELKRESNKGLEVVRF